MVAEPEGSTPLKPNLPMDKIQRQFQPPPILTAYFPTIHLNVILPSSSRFFKWTFSRSFPANIPYAFLVFPIPSTCPIHTSLPTFGAVTMLGKLYESPSFPFCILLRSKYHKIIFHTRTKQRLYIPCFGVFKVWGLF